MALIETGQHVFEAFNDPRGVEHFYAQARENLAAEARIQSENAAWEAKVQAKRELDAQYWIDAGIDVRMLDYDGHSVDIAKREDTTWLAFQIGCLGMAANPEQRERQRQISAIQFAKHLGFSAADTWDREPAPTPPLLTFGSDRRLVIVRRQRHKPQK